jgi:hypothetical protein
MKINLKSAKLHTPLFLSGTNLGLDLDTEKRPALKLYYDRGEKELIVTLGPNAKIIPSASVADMSPLDPDDIDVAVEQLPVPKKAKALEVQGKIKAQVSTPQSHVFAGDPGSEK